MNTEKEYYLYRQIRLDKNEPFYIGIGTIQKKNPYKRLTDKITKNKTWKEITSKTDYISEVIIHSYDDTFIQNKEKEFIEMYGRICKGKGGSLANKQTGGRGGKEAGSKIIYCLNNRKYYESLKEASEKLHLDPTSISRVVNKVQSHTGNYIFRKVEEKNDFTNNVFIEDGEIWKPLVNEKYGYFISNLKRIKKVDMIEDDYGSIIYKKEKEVKPVIRDNGVSVQITISCGNTLFNVNLRKEYFNSFNTNWNDVV